MSTWPFKTPVSSKLDEERKRGDQHSAEELFLQGFDILGNLLSRENTSIEVRVNALRRKSGLCIALAKIYKRRKNNSWKEYIENAICIVDEGIDIIDSNDVNLPPTPLRTFPYNGCCAYSLLSKWENNFDDQVKLKIKKLFQRIQSLDSEETHIFKLLRDSDFSHALEKIGNESWIVPKRKMK